MSISRKLGLPSIREHLQHHAPVRDINAAHMQIEGASMADEKKERDTALEAYDTAEMIGDYFSKIKVEDVRRAREKSGYVCRCAVCAAYRAQQQQKP